LGLCDQKMRHKPQIHSFKSHQATTSASKHTTINNKHARK